ncbi:glycosyltransferase [Ancylobacter polymorphus]|uniref:Glycosyltransferase subfamily 4-like N-terminal domain-containing protein n=1 Tax=Ancylobacter polymorphus TaxID=223390 RepID=A0ABU0BFJ6_9HYPH|nr:glycosyltransferase [Ancylobacter polymorphus]MDQ0304610.1 hypothetical protein [Ancylobacter polymorphus]
MKIAFISQYFFPEQFSNTAIARDLIARGHDVHVFTCVPNYPAGVFFEGYSNASRREENWEGIRISRVYTFPHGKTAAALLLNYLVFPLAASWTLSRRLAPTADVSFVSMPSPLLQAFAGLFLRWQTGTQYINRADDDWVEFFLETGLAGGLLALLFLVWFGARVCRLWIAPDERGATRLLVLQQCASLAVLLLMLHSFVDYPLRTAAMLSYFAACCALMTPAAALARVTRQACTPGPFVTPARAAPARRPMRSPGAGART